MDRFFTFKDRHVVVATGDEVEGKIPVRWVALASSVSGVSKRGRRPEFVAPVAMSDLVEITDADVLAQLTAPAPVVAEVTESPAS